MIRPIDDPALKRDPDHLVERHVRPLGIADIGRGLRYVVPAGLHVGDDAHPSMLGLLDGDQRGSVPRIMLPVRSRQRHRPKEQRAGPRDGREERDRRELASKFRRQCRRYQIGFPIVPELDDRHR